MIARVFSLLALLVLVQYSDAQIHVGIGQAYANLQSAQPNIKPGDTVYLHAGVYAGYQGISSLKGTESKWISIVPFSNDTIEISGGWQFMSCEYIRLRGLTFRSTSKYPGRLLNVDNSGSCETQSRHIIIDSCSFSNTTDNNAITTLKFGGVDSFVVRRCVFKDLPVCNAMDFNVCHHGLIAENRIENCLSGGHIKGGGSDIIMERNLFLNASQSSWVAYELGGDTGAEFYCAGDSTEVQDLIFRSNIIVGGYRGIALSSAVNCQIVNNTFYNCGQATLRLLTTSTKFPRVRGNVIENNIFAFGSSAYINGSPQSADAASFTSNIYASIASPTFSGAYWDTPALDAVKDAQGMVIGSGIPLFTAPTANDFHLDPQSPAVASGSTQHLPPYDFYGQPYSKSSPSIGAVESTSSPTTVHTDLYGIASHNRPTLRYIDGALIIRGHTDSSPLRICIYDCRAELVCTHETVAHPPGSERIVQLENALLSGVYFCILQCSGTQTYAPLIVTQ